VKTTKQIHKKDSGRRTDNDRCSGIDNFSSVEQVALAASTYHSSYAPAEQIPTIVVENFPVLGKLAAFRFIEWVQQNPGGVISLPTGKTPEHFIHWVKFVLSGWGSETVIAELKAFNINCAIKPDMKTLHFVQIDEFYPMEASHKNSFYHYVQQYYIKGFGLDSAKALLINTSDIGLKKKETLKDIWPQQEVDLTLRYRKAITRQEEKQKALLASVDQWCVDYEASIKKLGGIGFFLGGIGPDGHIGFNISGSDHYSTTRLCPVNYETQAAAAVDLGGIEVARKSLVITIGLRTITWNKNCTAIIIAAGQAKADIVARAIESTPTIKEPATVLGKLPNARFYITQGAAASLKARQFHQLELAAELRNDQVEDILIDLASSLRKQLLHITEADVRKDRLASLVLQKRREPLKVMLQMTYDNIVTKIEKGVNVYRDKKFLHTEPHHDDIMLGYFSYLVRHFREPGNSHHFVTLTSGFTSVTNGFMLEQVEILQNFMKRSKFGPLFKENYFAADNMICRNRDIWQYLDGVAEQNEDIKNQGYSRRFLRNLIELYGPSFSEDIDAGLNKLHTYFDKQYPGQQDDEIIKKLKGMCREWEVECLWGYYGWQCEHVSHLRLSFYTGDIFTKEPTMKEDVPPVTELMKQIDPDIISLAFDPEGSGPDTHYKVMQALAEAIHVHEENTGRTDLKIWGYRNVWFRFKPSEANIYTPVSLNMFSIMHDSFMNAFSTQKKASFPSYEHDGPFSELAQRIQVAQYEKIKICLGREWFYQHQSPLIRATRGLMFLKEMKTDDFYQSCRQLSSAVEL